MFSSMRIVSRIKHKVLGRVMRMRVMQFPTFNSEIHGSIILHYDYVRYCTIGTAIQRIVSENVRGSLAEIGVYKGEVSRFVHRLVPERKYYLFDTFEGFPDKILGPNVTKDDRERFRDTSAE